MNIPIRTQFDNIGVFEFEGYDDREMVQQPMHEFIGSIAKSTDLTVNEINAISKRDRQTNT